MKNILVRGSVVLNIITILLLAVMVLAIARPRYEHAKLKRNFTAAMEAGEDLYNAAQTYYIERRMWPAAATDLRPGADAKYISDWVIGNKIFSCEIAYGRGDRNTNDIRCSPMGKYASAVFYQIVLSDRQLNQRFCWAAKVNKEANDMCKEIGGVFSRDVAGRATPLSVYVVKH